MKIENIRPLCNFLAKTCSSNKECPNQAVLCPLGGIACCDVTADDWRRVLEVHNQGCTNCKNTAICKHAVFPITHCKHWCEKG